LEQCYHKLRHSMGFSRTFLLIKAENQNFPQMLLG